MTRYLALLRGINVGGNKRVPMPELRELTTELGFTDVATYINSGNLVLTSAKPAAEVREVLEQGIVDRFGFGVPIVVRTAAQIRRALKKNPYPEGNPAQVNVAFCSAAPEAAAAERIEALAGDDERFTIEGSEVFVDYAGGLARSKLAAGFDKAVGVAATTRNIRTVTALVDLLGDG